MTLEQLHEERLSEMVKACQSVDAGCPATSSIQLVELRRIVLSERLERARSRFERLTYRQLTLLDFIVEFYFHHGFYPFGKEMMAYLRVSAPASPKYTEPLIRKGFLEPYPIPRNTLISFALTDALWKELVGTVLWASYIIGADAEHLPSSPIPIIYRKRRKEGGYGVAPLPEKPPLKFRYEYPYGPRTAIVIVHRL